jgi:hypothetical protein
MNATQIAELRNLVESSGYGDGWRMDAPNCGNFGAYGTRPDVQSASVAA